ncbi:MAG: M28 family peptidase, partial [Desulfurococcales archaeon]|nr:M28 family peptidase [Desulfurococcales archaeon]
FHSGAPTPVAVGYLEPPRPCGPHALPGRARVYVEARTLEATAWGLEARLPGRGRPWLLGAHWDRWPGGFQDDTLGVAQAIAAAVALARRGLEARVLVFPSEEHGAPGYAGWYWAWGSRFYSRQLAQAGLGGEYAGYINFDMAGSTPLVASGSPALLGALGPGGWRARPWECPECDSMQLAMLAGIPTLSIHTLWTPKAERVYHTSLDTPGAAEPGAARLAVRLAVEAALRGPQWRLMDCMVEGLLGHGPLEARRLAVLILQAARRAGWEALHPPLARAALRPIDYGSRRWGHGPLEAHWFPEASLLPRLRSDLRRGRDPGEVWVAGWEEPLYQTRASPRARACGLPCLAAQARGLLEEMAFRVEEAVRSVVA